jgi:predicted RNA-binding protein with PUA-like domain
VQSIWNGIRNVARNVTRKMMVRETGAFGHEMCCVASEMRANERE